MWRSVARDILLNGFYLAGGVLEINEDVAINLMSKEFYDTSEVYRKQGPSAVCTIYTPYKSLYTRIQTTKISPECMDTWTDEVWDNVLSNVAKVHSQLSSPTETWLSNFREMYSLHESVILGILWAISHIPTENEKNHYDSNSDYEDDYYCG